MVYNVEIFQTITGINFGAVTHLCIPAIYGGSLWVYTNYDDWDDDGVIDEPVVYGTPGVDLATPLTGDNDDIIVNFLRKIRIKPDTAFTGQQSTSGAYAWNGRRWAGLGSVTARNLPNGTDYVNTTANYFVANNVGGGPSSLDWLIGSYSTAWGTRSGAIGIPVPNGNGAEFAIGASLAITTRFQRRSSVYQAWQIGAFPEPPGDPNEGLYSGILGAYWQYGPLGIGQDDGPDLTLDFSPVAVTYRGKTFEAYASYATAQTAYILLKRSDL